MSPTILSVPPKDPGEEALASLQGLELIYDDGEPLESQWHVKSINLLIQQIDHHFSDRTDYYVGGNNFIYFSVDQVRNRDFRGPDFYYVPNTQRFPIRDAWVVWNENGRTPSVVIELTSFTTAHVDHGAKVDIYRDQLHVREYFIYDRIYRELTGWRLQGGQYIPIEADANGRMWCEELQLAVGMWQGVYDRDDQTWLRFFHRSGAVVATFAEAEHILALSEQAKAKSAILRAEEEKARAEEEKARAEEEKARAEAALQEVARLQALLAQLQQTKPNGSTNP